MGILLVAAFLAINVYSLLYMLCIALGMTLTGALRRRLWRYFVLPLLGIILVWQYAVLVEWPPFMGPEPGKIILQIGMCQIEIWCFSALLWCGSFGGISQYLRRRLIILTATMWFSK